MEWTHAVRSRHVEWRLVGADAVVVWQVSKGVVWYYVGGHPDFPDFRGKPVSSVEEAKALAVAYYRMNQ